MGFREWLYRLIPRIISNRMLLRITQCMRLLQRHGAMFAASHMDLNIRSFKELIYDNPVMRLSPFIENQRQLTSMYIGLSTMAEAGCEVIAVYNALKAVSIDEHPLPELISEFEKDGIIRSGKYGVAAYAMRDHLKKLGYKTETTYRIDRMSEILEKSRTAILMLYNDRETIGEQVHSVCISRTPVSGADFGADSGYVIHNMYGDGRVLGPYKDMDDIRTGLRGGRTGPIALIGIL